MQLQDPHRRICDLRAEDPLRLVLFSEVGSLMAGVTTYLDSGALSLPLQQRRICGPTNSILFFGPSIYIRPTFAHLNQLAHLL